MKVFPVQHNFYSCICTHVSLMESPVEYKKTDVDKQAYLGPHLFRIYNTLQHIPMHPDSDVCSSGLNYSRFTAS